MLKTTLASAKVWKMSMSDCKAISKLSPVLQAKINKKNLYNSLIDLLKINDVVDSEKQIKKSFPSENCSFN